MDVIRDKSVLASENILLTDALMQLYAKEGDGRTDVGVDAFLLIESDTDETRPQYHIHSW